jgi:hypothetical protein
MFDQSLDATAVHSHENDVIACNLLHNIDHYEQFAILYSIETEMLKRVLFAACASEDYEICQVIKELLEERKMMNQFS